jgi:hypothetical protein
VLGKLATSLSDLKATINNSYVSNVIIANSKPPLFSDNFEDGDSSGWTAATGTWSVVTDDTKVLAQQASAAALITAGNSWTDYAYEARMEIPISNANAGIVFRVQDASNYYMYRMNSTANELELYKCVGGTLTLVSSTPFTAAPNQWYTVKAVVQGNQIQGYVDGVLQTDWTNPVTELTAGKIGFRTTSANVLFDDALVTSIDKAPTDISLTNDSVAENTTAGGIVGTFSSTDPDTGESFIYNLVTGAGDTDNGSFTISGDTLILGVTPDYEVKNSYSIRVRSIDTGGLYVDKNFTILITDVNETSPTPDPNALFSDNFEDGDSAGWTVATGTWSVVTDNSKVLAQQATTEALITAGNSWTDYAYEAKMEVPISNANAGIIFRAQDASNYYMYRINSTANELELYKCVGGTLTLLSSTPFTAAPNQWYTVKAVVQGNHIQGYVDGVLQTDWTNPVTELTAGKIGFRTTSASVHFDNVLVTPLLFSDNFEDGDSSGWTAATGTWSVVTDSTKVLAQQASAAALITAGNSWTDYAYEARMEIPVSNANAGIIFRAQDASNYYMYRMNSTANELELYKCVGGTLTLLSSTPFTAAPSQWYTVKAVIQGNHIQGYVDGVLQTDWTNPVTELTAGKIGFRTTSANVLFDDVLVTD